MALDQIAKFKVLSLLKSGEKVSYQKMITCHGKQLFSDNDYLMYLGELLVSKLSDTSSNCLKTVEKLLNLVNATISFDINNKRKVDIEVLRKLEEVIPLYETYCEVNNIEYDKYDVLNTAFGRFKVIVRQYFSGSCEMNVREQMTAKTAPDVTSKTFEDIIENADSYKLQNEVEIKTNKIKELEKEIKKLQATIVSEEAKHDKTKKSLSVSKERIVELNSKIKELEKNIKELKKEVKAYEKSCTSLEQSKGKIHTQYEEIRDKVADLTSRLEESESLVKSLNAKIGRYEARLRILDNMDSVRAKDEQIDKELFNLICTKRKFSVDDFVHELKLVGVYVDRDKVYERLMVLKNKINIISNDKCFPISYSLCEPKILTDQVLNVSIPNGSDCLDLLLVSDFHLTTMDNGLVREYDKLVNYCVSNNIKLVLNAGDLFSSRMNNDPADKRYYHFKKVIENVAERFPKDSGLYHAIMGGNHDENILEFGIDPIKEITTMREDFIDLGYDRASIILGNDKIMMHHPVLNVDNVCKHGEMSLGKFLNGYYRDLGIDRDETYLDMLGHIHMSSFNGMDGYVVSPSYLRDRRENGAWHLKVYFDEKMNIKYIILIPLVLENKLVPITEIGYQKSLLK